MNLSHRHQNATPGSWQKNGYQRAQMGGKIAGFVRANRTKIFKVNAHSGVLADDVKLLRLSIKPFQNSFISWLSNKVIL